MPYAPEHKEQTRARIVECARRMFNRYSFEAVSIDQIMASAGLTRGGFCHHFANEEELYSEAARRVALELAGLDATSSVSASASSN